LKTALAFTGTTLVFAFLLVACHNPVDGILTSHPPFIGSIAMEGDAVVGQTLRANTFVPEGEAVIFLWRKLSPSGTASFGIGNGSPYHIVQRADVGYTIVVAATRPGHSNALKSWPTDLVTYPEGLIINDEDLRCRDPYYFHETIPFGDTKRMTVVDSHLYDSIVWSINGAIITGDAVSGRHGKTLTMCPDVHENLIGTHVVIVRVLVNGEHYSALVRVTVSNLE